MAVPPHQVSTSDREPLNNQVTILSVGGLSAALLASICCIGPLVFAALGVGVGATGFWAGTAGFLKGLLRFRLAFIGLTILLLGIGFYLAYRKPESARRKPTMWRLVHTMIVIGVVTVSLAGFQGLVAGSHSQQTVTLQIDGMTCGGCVKDVKTSLGKVTGVSAVEISVGTKWVVFSDYSNARAAVTFDPQKTNVATLVRAVEAVSNPLSKYRAQVIDK